MTHLIVIIFFCKILQHSKIIPGSAPGFCVWLSNRLQIFDRANLMGTSLLANHRFGVEITRRKFIGISSILKGESTRKLWHRFDVDSTLKIGKILTSFPFAFFRIALTNIIMPIFINKIIYIFFKVTLTKVSNANIYMYKQFYISCKIILNKRFLDFQKPRH